eukprot:gene5615-11331_t
MKAGLGKMNSIFGGGSTIGSPSSAEKEDESIRELPRGKSFGIKFENMGQMLRSVGKSSEEHTDHETTGKSKAAMSIISSMSTMGTSMTSITVGGRLGRSASVLESGLISSKISAVISVMEDFRLQCPQSHAGLVIAFSGSSMSPVTAPDLIFKWHRIDPSTGQFTKIVESEHAWYPPTADDIGRKICVQCEDSLDQGFCRYVEAGPVAADPLLVAMLDSAMNHSRFEVRDVTVSMECNGVTPITNDTGVGGVEVTSVSPSNADTTSLPSPTPSTLLPSSHALNINGIKLRVDVGYGGIVLGDGDDAEGGGTGAIKTGVRILPSENIRVQCILPTSVLVTIPLGAGVDGTGSASQTDIDMVPSEVWEWVGPDTGVLFEQLSMFMVQVKSVSQSPSPSQPESKGGSDSGPAVTPQSEELSQSQSQELRVIIGCSDRMQRDALALSIRALSAFPAKTDAGRRLRVLPWLDGEGSVAQVAAVASQDICSRLKRVEEENAALRRDKNELTLQLLELGTAAGPTRARGLEDGDGQHTEQSGDASAVPSGQGQVDDRIKVLEASLSDSRSRELDGERTNLELSAKNRRLIAETESQAKTITDLRQRLAGMQESLLEETAQKAKDKVELETCRAEIRKLEQQRIDAVKVVTLEKERAVKELRTALSDAESDLRRAIEDRVRLEEQSLASNQGTSDMQQALKEAQARCSDLETQLASEVIRSQTLSEDLSRVMEEKRSVEREAISPAVHTELQTRSDGLLVTQQYRALVRKAESLSKDLRRVMHEAADRERDLDQQLERRMVDIEGLRRDLESLRQREKDSSEGKDATDASRKKILPNLQLKMGMLGRSFKKGAPPPVDETSDRDKDKDREEKL